MKKVEGNIKSVQVKDILYIADNSIIAIPASIWDKVFLVDATGNLDDAYIKFNKDSEIEFFDKLDFIYDIDYLNNLTSGELADIQNSLELEYNETWEEFSKCRMGNTNYAMMKKKMASLDYKKQSLSDYINSRVIIKSKIIEPKRINV